MSHHRAVAVFCGHDIMYGAHVVKSDEAFEIVAASRWLEPRRGDWLQMVSVGEVRQELDVCRECGVES